MKTSKITLVVGGKKQSYSVEYDSLESLSKSVFDLTCQEKYCLDHTVVTLDGGDAFYSMDEAVRRKEGMKRKNASYGE